MSKILNYNTENLAQDISRMNELIQLIQKDIDEMNAEVQALSAMWEGEAKKAFTAQFAKDFLASRMYLQKIREVKEHMEFAKTEYEKCDKLVYENIKMSL
jgi:WXG100 family type VII secretion target